MLIRFPKPISFSEHVAIADAVANAVGVETRHARPNYGERRGVLLTLAPTSKKWKRNSPNGRNVFAVCFHGHRNFFVGLYACQPDAFVRSMRATYRNGREFFNTFETADGIYGSEFYGAYYSELCNCSARDQNPISGYYGAVMLAARRAVRRQVGARFVVAPETANVEG